MEVLTTRRLILRRWEETDSADLYEYAKSELVGPRAGWKPHKTKEDSKAMIAELMNNGSYAIVLKENNKVIGNIRLREEQPDNNCKRLNQKEIGYVLNPDYWGRGYMPEAVECLIGYGFNNLGLDIIWSAHLEENIRSKRVSEKCGFRYQFTKSASLNKLNNKEVRVLYYKVSKKRYKWYQFKRTISGLRIK